MTATAAPYSPARGDAPALGPLAVSALLLLIVATPLMRGGNRQVALVVLEAVALVFLAAVFARGCWRPARIGARESLIGFLLLSPAWLAVIYLLPLPLSLWTALPGRAEYARLLEVGGIAVPGALPVSLAPDATLVSLLAGIPMMAAFAGGYFASLGQLRVVMACLAGSALVQVLFGVLQIPGGSALAFGSIHTPPYGTFANKNHYANYLAMALAGYIWLAAAKLSEVPRVSARIQPGSRARKLALWVAGAVLLLAAVLMARSRGALLAGVPMAVIALILAWNVSTRKRNWRITALVVAGVFAAGSALVGLEETIARFGARQMADAIPLRTIQAASTLEGAAHFWPIGSGWGTYRAVYPRFQPAELVGTADHAHQDYAEMAFEGGLVAVLLMCAFALLAVHRTIALARAWLRNQHFRREEFASAICGLGLLGFLLHSGLEFNMHIPANAFVAALLAGVFLRPLEDTGRSRGNSHD